MRITFVLPHAGLAGGIRVAAIYAEALAARGHDVTVVSLPHRDRPLKSKVKSFVTGRGWPRVAVTPSHFDGRPVAHRVLETFRPITAADVPDADVVVATWWETAEWVAAMPPRKGAKVYFLQHDETVTFGQPTDRVNATWHLPMRKIAVAAWIAQVGRERHGVDDVTVVPNGVDVEHFSARPRGKAAVPTVGVLYSHTPFKGCDRSLAAFRAAAERVPNLKLVAFGQEAVDDALPLPAGAAYTRRPPQDEIPSIYAACDAWLFGSRSEGFGLPILEAMACGTPVIGTPAGAAPELIGEGGGILVDEQTATDGMAAAIERVATMPDGAWRALSAAARSTAERNTWAEATDSFECALLEAAGAGASPQVAGSGSPGLQ